MDGSTAPRSLALVSPVDDQRRRDESARHYVGLGPEALTSLRTTITLAQRALGFPAVLLTVVDETDLHTVCEVGAPGSSVMPRDQGLCDGVVREGVPRILGDVRRDVPGHDQLALGEFRAYLGVPVHGREGLPVGALCVADVRPREITEEHVGLLTDFASVVEDQLDLARRRREGELTGAVDPATLATAIDEGQVVPWYQPMVDMASGTVVGVEALARWEHPEHGLITPASFIPVAEDSDLIIDLDLAVLRRAMTDLARWRRRVPGLRLSVNLSGKHLRRPSCVDALAAAAESAGIPATAVDLEITETAAISADGPSGAQLQSWRDLGFGILLDDFGTGWSALEHLLHLPVDGIKIDRALTAALGTAKGDAVVRAVTGMSRDMGISTVVEGVESAAAAWRARELGCTTGQGYLWSAAVPGDRLLPLLLARPRSASA